MKEFQVVIVRLRGRSREDEEAITDLLNERMRGGWDCHSIASLGASKVLVAFSRET